MFLLKSLCGHMLSFLHLGVEWLASSHYVRCNVLLLKKLPNVFQHGYAILHSH